MTILVTGATGFVGARFCERLRAAGHAVRATLRPSPQAPGKARTLNALGVETVTLDLQDVSLLSDAMAGVEAVYHLAWKSHRLSQGGPGPVSDSPAETNLRAMDTLIGCAKSAGVKKFVFTSTVSLYGPNPEWGPLPRIEADARQDLDQHPNPYFRGYAGAKHTAEQMLKAAFPPPDYVILRPAMVYGPHAQFARNFIEGARNGQGAGPSAHPIQWVHVDDVARALEMVLTHDGANQGIFNIAGASAVLNHTVAAEVSRLLGVPSQFGPVGAGDWSPRVPRYDISAAERAFGFRPEIGWKAGLAEMVAAETGAGEKGEGKTGAQPTLTA